MRRELGQMEKAQASINEHYPLNAVIVVCLTNGPSGERLKKSLDFVKQQNPILGVHILRQKSRYDFESEGTPDIAVNLTERTDGGHWQTAAEEELNRGFNLAKGPLVRVTYLFNPGSGGDCELIFTFQHSIMDAVSASSFLDEFLRACSREEPCPGVEKKDQRDLRPAAEAFFPPAFQGWRRRWNVFRFLLRQGGDELLYRLRMRGKRKPPVHSSGKCRILSLRLSRETTKSLLGFCRKNKITLSSLLTAAILKSVHTHLYGGKAMPMRHIHTADLRPYLKPPLDGRQLGCYFSLLRMTVRMKENSEIGALAREVGDIAYSSLRRGDKFGAYLTSYQMMQMLFRSKSLRIGTTAVTYTGLLTLERTYGRMEVREVRAFVSNFVVGPEYSAVAKIFDGRVDWDILYLDSDMDREKAETIAQEIRAILEAAAGGAKQ
jgi:Phthiocerol/phthiodiolone dimycocerosyl transferase C-terminus